MAVHFSGELQVPDWKKGWRNPSSMVMKHVREKLDLLKGRHIDDRGGEWRPYKKRSRWRLTTCGWLCLTTVRPVSEGNCLALRLTMSDDSQTSLSKQPSGVRQSDKCAETVRHKMTSEPSQCKKCWISATGAAGVLFMSWNVPLIDIAFWMLFHSLLLSMPTIFFAFCEFNAG